MNEPAGTPHTRLKLSVGASGSLGKEHHLFGLHKFHNSPHGGEVPAAMLDGECPPGVDYGTDNGNPEEYLKHRHPDTLDRSQGPARQDSGRYDQPVVGRGVIGNKKHTSVKRDVLTTMNLHTRNEPQQEVNDDDGDEHPDLMQEGQWDSHTYMGCGDQNPTASLKPLYLFRVTRHKDQIYYKIEPFLFQPRK